MDVIVAGFTKGVCFLVFSEGISDAFSHVLSHAMLPAGPDGALKMGLGGGAVYPRLCFCILSPCS